MDPVVEDLGAEHVELKGLLEHLTEEQWLAPTRCEVWDVTDVVIHLAQTDEMAIGSASGRFVEVLAGLAAGLDGATSIDEGVARMVARERATTSAELLERWAAAAAGLVDALDSMDLSQQVMWVTGELSARSMATTRLAETWIHAGDIAGAVGVAQVPGDRLRQISRLAWRTLPYAFSSAGREMSGPVAFRLVSPSGESWDLLPEEEAATTISGPAIDLCNVASRRVDASATALAGEGPDAQAVLELVRTYA